MISLFFDESHVLLLVSVSIVEWPILSIRLSCDSCEVVLGMGMSVVFVELLKKGKQARLHGTLFNRKNIWVAFGHAQALFRFIGGHEILEYFSPPAITFLPHYSLHTHYGIQPRR